jgi:DNA uptake protein ComE-like DNA-binding protein
MRRDAGAVIVLLLCLLIKFPHIVRDYQWLKAASNPQGSLDSVAASVSHSPKQTSPPSHRQDSDRDRSLSTQVIIGNRTPNPASSVKAKTAASSRKAQIHVPQAYLEDPLAYLSSAPPESLVFLPGIGPVIAERIANAAGGKRSFTRWEDLLSVKGIGPKKLEILKQIATTP